MDEEDTQGPDSDEKKAPDEERAPQEAEKEERGEIETAAIMGEAGALFSPEGILMMGLAVGLDLVGFVELIPVAGSILSYVPDILGLLIIGGWQIFRSQTISAPGRAGARAGQVAQKAKKLKWLRPLLIVGEFIPIVGTLPCWTIAVWFELKG